MSPEDAIFLSDWPATGNHNVGKRYGILEIIECRSI